MMSEKTRRLTNLSLLAAMAYIMVALIRLPLVPGADFLHYEPKDVIIAVGGLMYGPVSAMLLSVVVSLIEMVTISVTGFIGAVMNILSSCAFACTAAYIYSKTRTLKGAVIGLAAGCAAMTAVMLLWNYLITPLYMGYPREAVTAMLVPVFLPFNLLKSAINAVITMLLYKPLSRILKLHGAEKPQKTPDSSAKQRRISLGVTAVCLALLATLILIVLAIRGVI